MLPQSVPTGWLVVVNGQLSQPWPRIQFPDRLVTACNTSQLAMTKEAIPMESQAHRPSPCKPGVPGKTLRSVVVRIAGAHDRK